MYLADYVREFINREVNFELNRNVKAYSVFEKLLEPCLIDKTISDLTQSDLRQFSSCVKKVLTEEYKKFEDAVHDCITLYYRNRDFNDFLSCIVTKLEDSRILPLVKTCAENLPENERLPFSLALCVYSGLETLNSALGKMRSELKVRIRKRG